VAGTGKAVRRTGRVAVQARGVLDGCRRGVWIRLSLRFGVHVGGNGGSACGGVRVRKVRGSRWMSTKGTVEVFWEEFLHGE
jgi:hypothetical protein